MAPYDEPNMSDAALLMTVEDLINQAMGSPYKNVINFKLMQTVLHILARQQRLLEQRVEIRITDLSPPRHKLKKEKVIQESPESSSSAKSPRPKGRMADIKEEKLDKTLKEKAEKISQKEQEITGKGTSKEREKAEKQSQKEQERAEKLAQKDLEKAGKTAKKEQEKSEKQAQKDQEKAEKERLKSEKLAQKEKEKAEKTTTNEKEKMEKSSLKDKERAKSPKKEKKSSDTGIAISEGKRGKEKVLVVEKGPTTRSDAHARGSIDVVTQSQFALLEAAVRELRDMSAPMTMTMPDNEKLRSDLAKGNASLPDTMQAMQIDARVKAAERAIARMTGLLTQLAAAGGLPEDLEQQMEQMQIGSVLYDAEAQAEALKLRPSARKSVVISPSAKISESTEMRTSRPSVATTPRPGAAATPRPSMSIMKQPSSRTSTATIDAGVTHDELEDSVNRLREELIKSMNNLTTRAAATADNALHSAKTVADKLDIAMSLDVRISTLHSLATDYAEQLNGFDAGLTTQMQSFREQMVQMRSDLKGGLTQLESVNNNAETAAVTELSERYQDLVTELDSTLHAHRSLTNFQSQLASELHSLVECVEMLREQKADKDEVADGLRDKADTSRLAGLLTEAEFAMARADLERRLAVCHDKFQRQDNVWMTAMKDLSNVVDGKSELVGLLSARDELQRELRVLHARLQVLAAVLGEPKAAVVKRQLALGAACAACGAPALMSPRDAAQGAPPRLPALRPPPAGAPSQEPCFKDWMPPEMPDDSHACQRWCGGSHTRMAGGTRRARAEGAGGAGGAEGVPTRPYTGYGTDGRLYMMEEELQPCVECNEMLQKVPDEVPTLDFGTGDQKTQQETVVNIHLAY